MTIRGALLAVCLLDDAVDVERTKHNRRAVIREYNHAVATRMDVCVIARRNQIFMPI